MINLTDQQYAAIGRVAVESGTLEREIEEYFSGLQIPIPKKAPTLGPKLDALKDSTPCKSSNGSGEFNFVLSELHALVERRNAVVHGVWSPTSNAPMTLGEVTVKGRKATLHANEINHLAKRLRAGRKLLLRLMFDHLPHAPAASKSRPKASAVKLKGLFLNP